CIVAALLRVVSYVTCSVYCFVFHFFFFQAEDGIRDATVTGVQTCALPISGMGGERSTASVRVGGQPWQALRQRPSATDATRAARSEERRVGKEGRSRWAPDD